VKLDGQRSTIKVASETGQIVQDGYESASDQPAQGAGSSWRCHAHVFKLFSARESITERCIEHTRPNIMAFGWMSAQPQLQQGGHLANVGSDYGAEVLISAHFAPAPHKPCRDRGSEQGGLVT
jgi:hypothetical protein